MTAADRICVQSTSSGHSESRLWTARLGESGRAQGRYGFWRFAKGEQEDRALTVYALPNLGNHSAPRHKENSQVQFYNCGSSVSPGKRLNRHR